jgi:hypothetical protein
MTQDEIIEMARQVCDIDIDKRGRHTFVCDEYGLEAFAKLVAQHERSECLKFCEQVAEYFPSSGFVGSYIGNKIRARGQA